MIIGICGFKGSGKDTMGDYLVKNKGFIKLSFADTLKDITAQLFNWDRNMLEGDTIDSRNLREKEDKWWSEKLGFKVTPRIMLQKMGTDIMRNNLHNDIWKIIVERKIFENKDKNIVITDCRFINEMDMVKKYNGKIIRIHRFQPKWYKDYKTKNINLPNNIHQSEIEWIKYNFDNEINNSGSLKELYDNIEKILNNNNNNNN